MKLLRARNYETVPFSAPGFTYRMAWIDLNNDSELQANVLAANVNILRRTAPFVYLFANGFTVDSWLRTDINDDLSYRRSLESQQLKRGVWLAYPAHNSPTDTIVTAILTGDVLPFIHLLNDEEFALLCLPRQLSINQIDAMLDNTATNEEAVLSLIASGGFVISIIDSVRWRSLSRDDWYDRI